jgi:hypothetical protein
MSGPDRMSRTATAIGGQGPGAAVPGPRGLPLLGSSLALLRNPLGT